VVKARGLPWSATADEVITFFSACTVTGGASGVHFTTNREGRPSGECFVELNTEEDVNEALKMDREEMGTRYVEVFECSVKDMEHAMGTNSGPGASRDDFGETWGDDGVVRLRGLPFESSKDDISDFFAGLEIEENGVLMVTDYNGRSSGEAFVQFTNGADASKALEKNKASMGRRYIEVFRSSMDEAKRAQSIMMGFDNRMPGHARGGGPMRGGGGYGGGMGRPGPYDRLRGGYGGGGSSHYGGGPAMPPQRGGGGGGRHIVHMRGLPFRVTEQEIAEWFSSVADPVDVMIHYNHDGRPSGEADAMFGSEREATMALQKNKQNMQHRYVELFYDGPGDHF